MDNLTQTTDIKKLEEVDQKMSYRPPPPTTTTTNFNTHGEGVLMKLLKASVRPPNSERTAGVPLNPVNRHAPVTH